MKSKRSGASWAFLIIVSAAIYFGAKEYLTLKAEDRDIKQVVREMDHEDALNAQRGQARNRCSDAVRSAVAPSQVLDFNFAGASWRVEQNHVPPMRAVGLAQTSTGFALPIDADVGGRTLSFECYLDSNLKVITVSFLGNE